MLVITRVSTRLSQVHNPFQQTGHISDDFGQVSHGVHGLSGLGMTVAEARDLLINGKGTAADLAMANQIYYAAYNQYVKTNNTSQDPNVIIAGTQVIKNADGSYSAVSNDPLPDVSNVVVPTYPGNYASQPNLLSMEDCSPTDSACVLRNNQRSQDNQVLTTNANNLYNRKICEYNWALNWNQGNHSAPNICGQYSQSNVPYDPSTLIAVDGNGIPVTTDGSVASSLNKAVTTVGKTLADVIASLTGQTLHPAATSGNVGTDGSGLVAGMDNSTLMWLGIAGIAAVVFVTSK